MRRQATLVAFYGQKPSALTEIIGGCQRALSTMLGSVFKPYDLGQVHATVVGLEAVIESPTLENLNFSRHRNTAVGMDLVGFRRFLLSGNRVPFAVQLAGFADRDYPFTSRGQRPFLRSFSIQGDKAVVMGWPITSRPDSPPESSVESRLYPSTLDQIRTSAQAYGILHDYHRMPGDVDNDFYFRVGLLTQAVDVSVRNEAEIAIRQWLAHLPPAVLDVNSSILSFVSYVDNTLPPATSEATPLAEESDPTKWYRQEA
jgi:hypothetical protein